MALDLSETLFSPTTLLWLIVSLAAAAILFGSINRRRSRLTDALRGYVDRNQDRREAMRSNLDATPDFESRSDEGSQD